MRYLLDTNVLSEPLRPEPNRPVLKRLEQHGAEIATAAPVWHELWFGWARLPRSRRRRAIEAYLTALQSDLLVLPYDDRAARWHATERARLVAAGHTPAFVHGQIAAIAVTNDLVLVTRNEQDFRPFRDLNLHDWF